MKIAALKIQSIQRGKMGRKRYNQKKEEHDTFTMESEVAEQSRRDARNAELAQEAAERRALEEMEQKAAEEAAMRKIQTAARGRSGRKKAARKRKQLEENKKKLQYVFRNYNVVKQHVQEWKHNVDQEIKYWKKQELEEERRVVMMMMNLVMKKKMRKCC